MYLAAYDGTPFVWVIDSGDTGMQGTLETYPYSAGAYGYDETSPSPVNYSVTGYVDGPFATSLLKALIESVRSSGVKTLVHPIFGPKRVVLPRLQWGASADSLGRHTFTLTCSELPETLALATLADMAQSAAELVSVADADFLATFNPLASLAVAEAAKDAVTKQVRTLGAFTSLPLGAGDASDALARLNATADTLQTTGMGVFDAQSFLDDVQKVMDALPFSVLLQSPFSEQSTVDDNVSGNSRVIAKNSVATASAMARKALAAMVSAAASTTFTTAQGADVARKAIADYSTLEITRVFTTHDVGVTLRKVAQASDNTLRNMVLQLPQERTAVVDVPTLSVVAAYELTGNPDYPLDSRNDSAGIVYGAVRFTV
jgi:prophage DNA circulation protein